jgi:hypothetical protein
MTQFQIIYEMVTGHSPGGARIIMRRKVKI